MELRDNIKNVLAIMETGFEPPGFNVAQLGDGIASACPVFFATGLARFGPDKGIAEDGPDRPYINLGCNCGPDLTFNCAIGVAFWGACVMMPLVTPASKRLPVMSTYHTCNCPRFQW